MSKSFVRCANRVGVVVAALLALSLFALPSASGADTVLGNAASQSQLNCDAAGNGGSFSVLQNGSAGPSYAVPAWFLGGTLTSWSVAATPDESETVQLEVWRSVSGQWTLVFISPAQTLAAATGLGGPFPLVPAVAVQSDDVLGLAVTPTPGPNPPASTGGGCIVDGSVGDDVLATFGASPPSPGDTPTFSDLGTYEVNVAATFVANPYNIVPDPASGITLPPNMNPSFPPVSAPVPITPAHTPVAPVASTVTVQPRFTG